MVRAAAAARGAALLRRGDLPFQVACGAMPDMTMAAPLPGILSLQIYNIPHTNLVPTGVSTDGPGRCLRTMNGCAVQSEAVGRSGVTWVTGRRRRQ